MSCHCHCGRSFLHVNTSIRSNVAHSRYKKNWVSIAVAAVSVNRSLNVSEFVFKKSNCSGRSTQLHGGRMSKTDAPTCGILSTKNVYARTHSHTHIHAHSHARFGSKRSMHTYDLLNINSICATVILQKYIWIDEKQNSWKLFTSPVFLSHLPLTISVR